MNTVATQSTPVKDESLDIKKWFFRILGNWYWFGISAAICLFAAFMYLRYVEPVYKSTASLMIQDEKKGGGGVMDNPLLKELNISGNGKLVENELEVLKSYDLMGAVVREEQLYVQIKRKGLFSDRTVFRKDIPFSIEIENPDIVEKPIKWIVTKEAGIWHFRQNRATNTMALTMGQVYEMGGIRFKISANSAYKPNPILVLNDEYSLIISSLTDVTRAYADALKVEPVSKLASVMTLSIEDKDPKKASAVLATLINIYNKQGLEDKNLVTTNTMDFLNERLAVVAKDLQSVEKEVEVYKTTNRITDISAQAQQYLDVAGKIDIEKAQQQTQLNIINDLERELVANQNKPELVPSTLGIAEPTMGALIQRHNELVLQKQRIEKNAGESNPLLVDVNNQIRDTRTTLLENVHNLRSAYNIALNDISHKDNQLSGMLGTVPRLEKDLVQIKRNQGVQEQLYFFLLQKREESAITLASNITDSRTIEHPRSMGKEKPKDMIVWAFALIAGLAIPILVLSIVDFFDNKVGNRSEVSENTKASMLGEVSFVKKVDNAIQVRHGSRSVFAEQLRAIRTSIEYTCESNTVKTILINSQRSGEGKSFISLNLAASYAQMNKKVVLLEFDLRKPRIAKGLNLTTQKGISNLLSQGASIDDALVEVPGTNGNLFLMPAGPIPPNPAELILSDKMGTMMQELRERFSYIIIDTPPFSMVTDSTLLQKFTDIYIVVLRQGYTFKQVYRDINERMAQFPGKPVYTLLNAVGKRGNYYGYGAGSYGYGYGEGYFDEENGNSKKNKAAQK